MARQSERLKENRAKSMKKANKKPVKKTIKRSMIKVVKKSKNEKKSGLFKCTECKKSFSKKSNLTTHHRSKHMGRRWECSICGEIQVSKYSHQRHIRDKHRNKNLSKADQNEYYFGHKVQMTHKAKDALIASLKNDIEKNETMVVILKHKMKELFAEISQLKSENLTVQQVETAACVQYRNFYDQHLKKYEEETEEGSEEDENFHGLEQVSFISY